MPFELHMLLYTAAYLGVGVLNNKKTTEMIIWFIPPICTLILLLIVVLIVVLIGQGMAELANTLKNGN